MSRNLKSIYIIGSNSSKQAAIGPQQKTDNMKVDPN